MSLANTLDQLKKTVTTSRAQRVYAEARPRHRALASFETVGAIVEATSRGSSLFAADRDAVFAALVVELQQSRESLWQSLLLVAFTPMLMRLRLSVRDPGNEDLDQSVVLAFLESVRSPVCRSYVARNLRLLTQSRLYAERRREHRGPELVEFDENTHPCDPFNVEAEQRAAAAEVTRIIEAEGGEELRELLLTTYGDDDSVKAHVDRAYAGCDERTRARARKRLCRARLAVFAKLRARTERCERVHAPAA
jgi:hypothetical protein